MAYAACCAAPPEKRRSRPIRQTGPDVVSLVEVDEPANSGGPLSDVPPRVGTREPIDYVVTAATLSVVAEALRETDSDHFPVLATISLSESGCE
jgi:hypothetical protein